MVEDTGLPGLACTKNNMAVGRSDSEFALIWHMPADLPVRSDSVAVAAGDNVVEKNWERERHRNCSCYMVQVLEKNKSGGAVADRIEVRAAAGLSCKWMVNTQNQDQNGRRWDSVRM